eukprot:2474042-Prymnesium_polylepis.1
MRRSNRLANASPEFTGITNTRRETRRITFIVTTNHHKLGGTMPNYRGEAILDPETRGRGRDLYLTSN